MKEIGLVTPAPGLKSLRWNISGILTTELVVYDAKNVSLSVWFMILQNMVILPCRGQFLGYWPSGSWSNIIVVAGWMVWIHWNLTLNGAWNIKEIKISRAVWLSVGSWVLLLGPIIRWWFFSKMPSTHNTWLVYELIIWSIFYLCYGYTACDILV